MAQPLYEEAQTSVIALDTLLRGNSYPFFTSLDAPLVTRANMDRYRKLLQDVNNWRRPRRPSCTRRAGPAFFSYSP